MKLNHFFFVMYNYIYNVITKSFDIFSGYDNMQIPYDSFQGLDLWSPSLEMDMDGDIGAGELLSSMPSPPQGDTQAAAWYDTDL